MNFFLSTVTLVVIVLFSGLLFAQQAANDDSLKQEKTKALLQKLLQESKDEAIQELTEKLKETDSQDSLVSGKDGLEIDGLIINETKTKIGQDFYEFFYNSWEQPENVSGFTMFIAERPAGRMGSWVWINVDQVTVFQNRLTPRADEIEVAAHGAVATISSYLINQFNDQRQLAGDEMAGTGIY